jgi:hypothetical protein
MRTQKSLYDKDFYKWSIEQANLLKKGEFTQADMKNIIEEIEYLARREKNEAESYLVNLLMHLLKQKYQPEKETNSWRRSISNARTKLALRFDSLSLKNKVKSRFLDCYNFARKKAAVETRLPIESFPEECPWTFEEVLD